MATWTETMLAKVRKRYPVEDTPSLARELGVKVQQLQQKAHALGVSKTVFSSPQVGTDEVRFIRTGTITRSGNTMTHTMGGL